MTNLTEQLETVDGVTQAKKTKRVPVLSGPDEARFWGYVTKGSDCWIWSGPTSGNATHKYGDMTVMSVPYRAHRLAYVLSGRCLAEGEVVDHLCRNTMCVNPQHLEAVSIAENTLRGASHPTHCKHGHRLDDENGRPRGVGKQRACRTCGNIRMAKLRAAAREKNND